MRFSIAAVLFAAVIMGCAQQGDTPVTPVTPTAANESTKPEVTEANREAPRDEFGIGDTAPKFENITGIDDKPHSLAEFKDAKAVVVVFTCNHCPVAVAYEDRLNELQNDYADKGVAIVAINVNNNEKDKLPAMKERAAEKGFKFQYLYDPTQQVGRDFGARVTPHIFLLDGERKLAYVGPIDDNMEDPAAAKPLLREAIDAVLAGKEPATKEVKPVGCGIGYES